MKTPLLDWKKIGMDGNNIKILKAKVDGGWLIAHCVNFENDFALGDIALGVEFIEDTKC